ncbi:hypothetical protein D1007_17472 [Hordeum vulgare]|nr:hypothetical protein D1007_17472 [Hordeum vulgare]
MAVAGVEWQFTIMVKVGIHMRKMDLSVVYINESILVGKSINTLEHMLAEDDKYKVVAFDLEYTGGRAVHDQMVVVAQSCVRHYVLAYHYYLARRPRERFAKFLNSPDFMCNRGHHN